MDNNPFLNFLHVRKCDSEPKSDSEHKNISFCTNGTPYKDAILKTYQTLFPILVLSSSPTCVFLLHMFPDINQNLGLPYPLQ